MRCRNEKSQYSRPSCSTSIIDTSFFEIRVPRAVSLSLKQLEIQPLIIHGDWISCVGLRYSTYPLPPLKKIEKEWDKGEEKKFVLKLRVDTFISGSRHWIGLKDVHRAFVTTLWELQILFADFINLRRRKLGQKFKGAFIGWSWSAISEGNKLVSNI